MKFVKNCSNHENEKLVENLSERFVRSLPLREGKASEMDELMALFAPSAWGVGLEGSEINIGNVCLVAGCFGAELFFNGARAGFPEHFRQCQIRCGGSIGFPRELAGPALQRAALSSQVFIALASPGDKLAWMQARATARAAKLAGSLVLLVAVLPCWRNSHVAESDAEDADCLLYADQNDPLAFLHGLSTMLAMGLHDYAPTPDAGLSFLRQLFANGHAVVQRLVRLRKYSLQEALKKEIELCWDSRWPAPEESSGFLVLLDKRDYADPSQAELVSDVQEALGSRSAVHVMLGGINAEEPYPESCSLRNFHDFYLIAFFRPETLESKMAEIC